MPLEESDFTSQLPTMDIVARWLDAIAAERLIPQDQARLRKTALSQLAKERGDREPCDATWMRDNLDELAARLMSSGVEKSTALTYKSRASSALRDFFAYRARPEEFRPSKSGRHKRSPTRASIDLHAFPLEGGRFFRYELPPRFTRRDLERLYLHLLALVDDFDDARAARKPVQLPLSASIVHEHSSREADDRE